MRVIGADTMIAPLLDAEAQRQLGLGWITSAQRNAFTSKMASGSGWPYHHHHIHVSMNFWGTNKPGSGPTEGCGLEHVRPSRSALPVR